MNRLIVLASLPFTLTAATMALADTAPPCAITIHVTSLNITAPTTVENIFDTMTDGGIIYFKAKVASTDAAQMALDYIVTFERCQDPSNECSSFGDNGTFTLPTSNVMGNGGSHTFSITVPNKTTRIEINATPFGRCGAVNVSSTLNKFFPGSGATFVISNEVSW
jgi:hypothetical protein